MNHKVFFKKNGKGTISYQEGNNRVKIGTVEDVYKAFKARLVEETNLVECNCLEEEMHAKRPGGWVCPVHGTRTVF